MKIKYKFALIAAFLFLSSLLTAFLVYQSANPIIEQFNEGQSSISARQDLLMQLQTTIGYGGVIHNFKNYVLRGQEKYYPRIKKAETEVRQLVREYKDIEDISSTEVQALNQIETTFGQYFSATDKVSSMFKKSATPTEVDKMVKISDKPAIEGLKSLQQSYKSIAANFSTQVESDIASLMFRLIAMLIVSFIVIIIIGSLIYIPMQKGIKALIDGASLMTEGDLSNRFTITSNDEISAISSSYNRIADSIAHSLGSIINSSSHLTVLAEKLRDMSNQSSKRSHNQIDEIARASADIDELSVATDSVSQHISSVSEIVKDSVQHANSGQKIVQQATQTMQEMVGALGSTKSVIQNLEKNSNDVSGILDTIRDVADQTNLLALNAAIEAARAGEMGRGFAVVADEVRNLAKRTQESTVEIQTMIEQLQQNAQKSVAAMQRGTDSAEESMQKTIEVSDYFGQIVDNVTNINEMTSQIEQAAQQQNSLSEQVKNNIRAVTQGAEKTKVEAYETNETSYQVGAVANELIVMMNRFYIDEAKIDSSSLKKHSKVVWDSSFETGIKELDRQHKLLLSIVNELNHNMKLGFTKTAIMRTIGVLIDYTKTHFGYEVALMERNGYPQSTGHQGEHDAFIQKMADWQKQVEHGNLKVGEDLLDYLSNWLTNHIKKSDVELAGYLKQQGVE